MVEQRELYEAAIGQLGLTSALKIGSDGTTPPFPEEAVFRSIFYSDLRDPQRHDIHDMMIRNLVKMEDSHFQDYILLLNVPQIVSVFADLDDKEITSEDVKTVMRTTLQWMRGKYVHGDTKRYTNRTGDTSIYVTLDPQSSERELSRLAAQFNINGYVDTAAFVKATELFLNFVTLHPFENGNGRTSRLLTNKYLLSHGLKPIMVTSDKVDNAASIGGMDAYHFSGYLGGFIGWAIVSAVGRKKVDEIISGLDNKKLDPHAVELRSILTVLSKPNFDREGMNNEVKWLYKIGKTTGDMSLINAAVWITGQARLENDILLRAMKDGDDGSRASTLLAMETLGYEKYECIIREVAISGSEYTRMAAIGIIGRNGGLDNELINTIMNSETNVKILGLFARALKSVDPADAIPAIEQLMSRDEEIVNFNAYRSRIAIASGAEMLEMLKSSLKNDPLVRIKGVIEVISVVGKLNNPEVSQTLSQAALENRDIRKIILGELAAHSSIDAGYVAMCSQIMRGEQYNHADRAYSMYLMGREMGFDYLQENFGVKPFDSSRSVIENTASILIYARDIIRGKTEPAHDLQVNDPQIAFVFFLELARNSGNGNARKELDRLLENAQAKTEHMELQRDRGSVQFYDILPSIRTMLEKKDSLNEARRAGFEIKRRVKL